MNKRIVFSLTLIAAQLSLPIIGFSKTLEYEKRTAAPPTSSEKSEKEQEVRAKGEEVLRIYVTRDQSGKRHYSDQPQPEADKVELSDSMNLTSWKKVKPIKVVKAKPPTKGDNVLSKKQKRCDKLEMLIERYRQKEKQAKDAYRYRALRRQHQWEKQKMNC